MEICASAYLASINGMASRIAADAEAIVASFEHLWNTMEPLEKASTLTDAIIEPEVALRYLRGVSESSVGAPREPSSDSRDEHGAPFLWHTRSQLDLVDLSKAVPCGALLQAATTKHQSPPQRHPASSGHDPTPKISKPRAPPPPPPTRPTPPTHSPPTSTSHAIVISGSQVNSDTEILVMPDDDDEEVDDRLPGHSPATEEKSLLCEYSKSDYDFLNNW
ncbi:uncharacterized protein C1orf198 homolog [Phlebotomus papatasi]|uniref:uncharacterized protein C1orf198 homolog n=1 Tax=Phlebotomus papatasi TaxID=29031 RepID=UPI002483A9F7|nr:uncharacterized protein C1orf198 homolog [Phlebotomus papatasi]